MPNYAQQERARALFKRYQKNPVLSPTDWPYPVNAVFNPAAVRINNSTLLLVRAEDMRGFSHLTVAKSQDGLTNWRIDTRPTMEPSEKIREEMWGVEDPRIVWLEEQRQYAAGRGTYLAQSLSGPKALGRPQTID